MLNRLFPILCLGIFACLTPPAHPQDDLLTDDQRAQLETAHDRLELDEGALYALLNAAVDWEPFDDAEAIIPSYDKIEADPAAARGRKFLIEGAFVVATEHRLSRPGPWGRAVSYWAIKYGDVDGTDGDKVVIVLMVDPNGKPGVPAQKQAVRVPAVFYKVWRTKERNSDTMAEFLVFVARAGNLEAALAGPPPGAAPSRPVVGQKELPPWPLILLIVTALVAAWFMLRRMLKTVRLSPQPTAAMRRHREPDDEDAEEEIEYRDDLPEDPAEAMNVLETEHEAAAAEEKAKPKKDPVAALGELEREHEADGDESAEPDDEPATKPQ